MFEPDDCVTLLSDTAPVSKRRRRSATDTLPARFFAIEADAKIGLYICHGFIVMGACGRLPTRSVPEIAEQLRTIASQCAPHGRTVRPEDALVWRIDDFIPFQEPVHFFPSASKRWTQVCNLCVGECDEVLRVHQEHSIRPGSMKGWLFSEKQIADIKFGDMKFVVTNQTCATNARVPMPDADDVLDCVPQKDPNATPVAQPLMGRLNTRYWGRNSWIPHEFDVDVIVDTIRMCWNLRSTSNERIISVITHALKMTLDEGNFAEMKAKLENGNLVLPKKSTILTAMVKIDVLYSVFLRTEVEKRTGHRYISADASSQHKVNILCARMISYLWPKTLSDEEAMDVDLAQIKVDRNLTLSTHGYGAASAKHKVPNMCKKVMIESGTMELFKQVYGEVEGYVLEEKDLKTFIFFTYGNKPYSRGICTKTET